MSRWELLEECIEKYGLADKELTAEQLGHICSIKTWNATLWIQSHKRAQREQRTEYVIYRVANTRGFNTRWRFGTKAVDVRRVVELPASDYDWLVRQLTQDLTAMAGLNPQLREQVQEAVTVLNTSSRLLRALQVA